MKAESKSQARRFLIQLPPGSDEAIKAGCTCPVLDNAHGKGYYGNHDVFVYTEGCPLHWNLENEEER